MKPTKLVRGGDGELSPGTRRAHTRSGDTMRLASLLSVSALAMASAFSALPRAPALRSQPLMAPATRSAVAASQTAEVQQRGPRAVFNALVSAVSSAAAKVNTSGLEYIGFAALYAWGLVCVAINTFLWIFRYTLEKSGLAPASWHAKPPKPSGPVSSSGSS